jgi:hypothetical protein
VRQFDVTDEAIIDAAPQVVYDGFVDEMNGKTSWWAPHHTCRLLSGESFDTIGATLESPVQTKWPVRYTTETVEVVPGEDILVEYTGGSLRSEADWTFEEATEGPRWDAAGAQHRPARCG